jgi:hypothetical protein
MRQIKLSEHFPSLPHARVFQKVVWIKHMGYANAEKEDEKADSDQ